MKWMAFRVRTKAEAEDIIISSMQDIGLYGAQIEDHVPLTAAEKEQMFVDILPDAGEDDGSAVLSFFLEETEDGRVLVDDEPKTPEEVKASILEELAELRTYTEIGDGTVTIEETEDVDWINNWKQYFHQFWIDDILAIPSWEKPEITDKEPALVFHIDPGTAFGTGMHETTQLCIRQIRKYLTPETVMLDVGTGSGILAILALMFGIKSAVGTDLDPCANPFTKLLLTMSSTTAENRKIPSMPFLPVWRKPHENSCDQRPQPEYAGHPGAGYLRKKHLCRSFGTSGGNRQESGN